MNDFNYSIENDTIDGTIDLALLNSQITNSEIFVGISKATAKADVLRILFKANISTLEKEILDGIVSAHSAGSQSKAKIMSVVSDTFNEADFKDIDYTIHPSPNLFPHRVFTKGELLRVDWFSDQNMTDLVLKTEMSYIRDPFGFAISRTTVRTWMDESGNPLPDQKITTKFYTHNPISQIEEGKRRRANIVNGIQLPTMGLMIESMSVAPYNYSQGQILLIGRDFLDRHESEFKNFIESSSSVTDFNDPNFGRKKVAVAIEQAANSTDPWLKETPSQLGGASIEQYLVGEFTI